MGSWQQTCPISGLIIRENDPIMFGLISRSTTAHDEPLHACTDYQFWTPLFEGAYDDYGSVIWNKIKPKILWDWLWGNYKKTTEVDPDGRFSKREMETDDKEVFDMLVHGDYFLRTDSGVLIPNEIRKRNGTFARVYMWMCHKWAFKSVVKMYKQNEFHGNPRKSNTIEEQLETYMTYMDHKEDEKFYLGPTASDLPLVCGECGMMYFNARIVLHRILEAKGYEFNMYGEFREDFQNQLLESLKFIHSLYNIRKAIRPLANNGQYYQSEKKMVSWANLVARKAKIQEAKYEADRL